jgi:carbon-monoxide dehydrogenase medium subunit
VSPFALETPATWKEALALLAEHGEAAKAIAGGTGLLNLMKQRLAFPEVLVSLHRVPDSDGIALADGSLVIGALARLAEVERHPAVRERLPMLAETLSEVASPRIRAMATIGGALAHADPHQDTPAALLALGASVRTMTRNGGRELPLETLYLDYYETCLDPAELVVEVRVPLPPAGSGASYLKFLPRSAEDYATVAAAALRLSRHGVCERCRIVLGSVGATPIRSGAAEALLAGEAVTEARCRAAGEHAGTGFSVASAFVPNRSRRCSASASLRPDRASVSKADRT